MDGCNDCERTDHRPTKIFERQRNNRCRVADARATTGFDVMAGLINAHPELRGVFW
jgi:hypothetical protein